MGTLLSHIGESESRSHIDHVYTTHDVQTMFRSVSGIFVLNFDQWLGGDIGTGKCLDLHILNF